MATFLTETHNATEANPITVSHTASGSDRFVLISVMNNETTPTVSYGSQTPTLIATIGRLHLYGLVNPATGAQTASADSGSSQMQSITVASFSGVDQATPNRTPSTATNDGVATITTSAASQSGDLVVDTALMVNLSMTQDSAQTRIVNMNDPGVGFLSLGMSTKPGADSSVSMSWSTDDSFGDNYLIAVSLVPSSSGDPAPTIDDVDGDDVITSTQTGWAVNGSDFDGATVDIHQGSYHVGQTVTGQTSTAITCTTVFDEGVGPHLRYGPATLEVTNADAQQDSISIVIAAPSGRSYVDLGIPNPTADNRITAVADLSAGDQLEVSNVQGGTIADVSVNSDATFDVDEAVTAFDVRAWDSSDQTWGAVGTQTVGDIPPPPEPPVFDGTIPNRSFVVNVAITSWDLSTYFTGATSYSSAGTLPTGLTLNASTGVLSGTPTATGTYSGITITGINDDGTDTSNAFTITITDTPPPPAPIKPRRRDGRRRGLLGYIYGRG
jgi:hypothetical protein